MLIWAIRFICDQVSAAAIRQEGHSHAPNMSGYSKIIFSYLVLCLFLFASSWARPDSAGHPPEGFAFGGIPYGSMSGNVAEYYRMKEAEAAHAVLSPAHYVAQPVVQYPNFYNYYH